MRRAWGGIGRKVKKKTNGSLRAVEISACPGDPLCDVKKKKKHTHTQSLLLFHDFFEKAKTPSPAAPLPSRAPSKKKDIHSRRAARIRSETHNAEVHRDRDRRVTILDVFGVSTTDPCLEVVFFFAVGCPSVLSPSLIVLFLFLILPFPLARFFLLIEK